MEIIKTLESTKTDPLTLKTRDQFFRSESGLLYKKVEKSDQRWPHESKAIVVPKSLVPIVLFNEHDEVKRSLLLGV